MSAPPSVQDPHLLVVDDDERLRALLQRYLTSNGYRVTAAANAGDARALMKSMAFDLLILDVMMPWMDGFEVLKALEEQPLARPLPIIMLMARSAWVEDCERRAARLRGLGAADVLFKRL